MNGWILLAISIVIIAYLAARPAPARKDTYNSKPVGMLDCMDELSFVEEFVYLVQPERFRPSVQRVMRDCRAIAKLREKVSSLHLSSHFSRGLSDVCPVLRN